MNLIEEVVCWVWFLIVEGQDCYLSFIYSVVCGGAKIELELHGLDGVEI